jgi:cobalt-precorrin 5A hydrolase
VIVAGFGFRKGAPLSSLQAALTLAAKGHGSVTRLATAEDKLDELRGLATVLGVPLTGVAPAALAGIGTSTQSAASLAHRGIGSVAEASALAVAGTGARLLGVRHVSPDRMATCAIAEGLSL